jgi:DNA-binding MarR family transcriptional regulator
MSPVALADALKLFSSPARAMTLTEIRTLLALPSVNSVRKVGVKEMAARIQTLEPSMSKTITMLVSLGFVTREEDQRDRRLVMLSRSQSGERLVQKAMKRIT